MEYRAYTWKRQIRLDQDFCSRPGEPAFRLSGVNWGLGQPAISKQVAALEAHLGAQLLMRTSRSLGLSEAGRDFYESAFQLINDLEAAESR